MNARRCQEDDYIEFLLAAQTAFGCVEASKSQPQRMKSAAHDAYTRLLTRRPLETEALWNEAQTVAGQSLFTGGLLVLDDSTLDKPYAQKIELVTRHWSGKHHRVVNGINLLSLVWTQLHTPTETRAPVVPLDFRVYDVNADADGKHFTKNDHFRAMVSCARTRGLRPDYVAFDSWYAGLENLKHVRGQKMHFLTQLKSNRAVNPDRTGLVAVATLRVATQGQIVQLRGFGLVRLFQKTSAKGEVEHWATSDCEMTREAFQRWAKACWSIENYHRGLKQCCAVEKAQVRSATGQKNHLLLALRAFLRLEAHRLRTGLSWYEAKLALVRNAIKSARTHFVWSLNTTA